VSGRRKVRILQGVRFFKIMNEITLQATWVDTPNVNGVTYPRSVMEEAIAVYNNTIQERKALGEYNPESAHDVDLMSASHIVEEVFIDGDRVMAKAFILDTPRGRAVKERPKDLLTMGLRGTGITTDGVCSDLLIISIDLIDINDTDHDNRRNTND